MARQVDIKDIELGFVELIEGILLGNKKLFAKQDEGEFHMSGALRENYHPSKSPYTLVAIKNLLRNEGVSSSPSFMSITAQLVLFIGAREASTGKAKNAVYSVLGAIRSRLDAQVVHIPIGVTILDIDTAWSQEVEEFMVENHVCWSQTYKITFIL